MNDVGSVDDSVEGDVGGDELVVTMPMEPAAPDSMSVKEVVVPPPSNALYPVRTGIYANNLARRIANPL